MKVSGRCYCGQISFEAEIEPDKVRVCHCTDCQTLSGSAFRTNVPVVQGTFVLKKGEPKTFLKSADSGNRIVHAFCPDCGTPIYSAVPGEPPGYSLRVGTLDRRAELHPAGPVCRRAADVRAASRPAQTMLDCWRRNTIRDPADRSAISRRRSLMSRWSIRRIT